MFSSWLLLGISACVLVNHHNVKKVDRLCIIQISRIWFLLVAGEIKKVQSSHMFQDSIYELCIDIKNLL